MGCINGEKYVDTQRNLKPHVCFLVSRQSGSFSLGKTSLSLDGSSASTPKNLVCHKRRHGDRNRFDTSTATMTKAKRIFIGHMKPIHLRLIRLQSPEHFGVIVILDEGFCLGHSSNKSRSNKLGCNDKIYGDHCKSRTRRTIGKRRPVPSAHR